MTTSSLISSAKIVCYVNGGVYGKATSFQWSVGTTKRPIMGLDSGEPYEFAPGPTKVTGQVGVLRLSKDGGLEGAGITVPLEELTREKYFSLTLVDRSNNTIIFRAEKCTVQSQSWTVTPRSFVIGSFDFEAINWANESTNPQR